MTLPVDVFENMNTVISLLISAFPLAYLMMVIWYDRKNSLHYVLPLLYVLIYIVYKKVFLFMDDGQFVDMFYLFLAPVILTFFLKFIRYRPLYRINLTVIVLFNLFVSQFALFTIIEIFIEAVS